ncbi:uncharacterized protein LOC135827211 [Sycon ciliatum]|uniref:uncharacterized protein LOC135827211 n=1 Tax=Sycon ciliatum TaxID=27933 RepID=UPI0031F6F2A6
MPTCQPDAVTRREIFKWCGKLTSHYPVGSWLRLACSYLKRLSSLQPGWDDPVSHEVVACCAEVIHRLQTDDPAQGVWSVPEDAQWSLWCDASDIAHGAVIQADSMIVEDGCWLRQKDDRRHINIAERDAVIKGLHLAMQWQVKELTLFTDSKTVAAWLQSVLGKVSCVRVSGLQQVLVQRRLQIITDLVAVTGLTVKVQWISSQQNKADQLTRVPSSWIRCGKTLLSRIAPSVTAAVVTVSPFSLDRVCAAQNADPKIVATRQQVIDGDPVTDPALVKVKSQLVVHDGMLCRSVKLPPNDAVVIPVIPSSLEPDVVRAAHVNCGHASWEGTWRFLRSKCYFPNMAANVSSFFVRHCLPCAAAFRRMPVALWWLMAQWSVVVIDTLELGVDQSGEYHCVLVCMDTFTKWVEVVLLCQHDAASVAEAFVGLCTRWGPPRVVRCDNGTEFINAVMSSLFDTFGVTVLNGAVRHPLLQGSVERFNRTLLTLIRKVLDEADDWRSELDVLLYFDRIHPHSVLKISPMRAMLGWEPSGVLLSATPGLGRTPSDLERQAARIRDFVEAELSSKDFVESEADNCLFAVGDAVLLRREVE